MVAGLDVAFAVLQERADEPLELLQLSGLTDQQVLSDGGRTHRAKAIALR